MVLLIKMLGNWLQKSFKVALFRNFGKNVLTLFCKLDHFSTVKKLVYRYEMV